jgi:2'-5' RNA ligase
MRRYCIFLIAESPALALIEDIRILLDPLSGVVPAHLTVVFPFSTEMSPKVIIDHVADRAAHFSPIETTLVGCHLQNDGYIHISVLDQQKQLSALHAQLYSGSLESFLDPNFPFLPHITIGRYTATSQDGAEKQIQRLSFPICLRLSRLVLEEILEDDKSSPLLEVTLGGKVST